MKIINIIPVIFLLALSCNKGSEIFAVINGENITRQEFNDWLESRNISVKSVYKDKFAMNDYLRQVAVEKVTAYKAENSGFKNEEIYKTVEKTLYKNLLSTFYSNKQREEVNFAENAVDISIIRLFLKKESVDESRELENKQYILESILNELKSGKDFNELAAKFSEDAAAKKKGHLGIIPELVLEEDIRRAVSQLNENEYTREPVRSGRSLCLIKLHKRYALNEKNIIDVVKEKMNSDRIIDFYKNKNLDEQYNKILKETSIISNIDTAGFKKRGELIFSIDGDSFTSGELDDILKLFYSLKHGVLSVDEFPIKEKKITSEKILKERLFAQMAERISIDKDPVFKRNWFYLKRATIAGSFKYQILQKSIKVTNEEVRSEYFKNRDTKYYRIKNIKGKETKFLLSFQDSRKDIINYLNREKLKSIKKVWDDGIINEGNFKILSKDFSIN